MTKGVRPAQQDRADPIVQVSAHDASESAAGRGRLRTYLGIAPGVGKTYAMLRDARAQRRSGVDTVVAQWERHGRPGTAAQLDDLEVLPPRTVTYRDASFAEPDVAAVLHRRPQLALVDELAHANLPGERHGKRWQDVDDLLASGIDVYTTLNVANIESLGPVVSRITGVRPAEPVPDAFVRAGVINLVDLAPSALRRRLAQGLVFPAEQVDAALSSYFRFANLAALHELAQLWLDDSVPDPTAAFLAARGIREPVPASVIVVGLAGLARRRMAHPLRRPSGRAVRRQAPGRYTSGRSTTSTGHPGPGWRRTVACSANWAGLCARSGPGTSLRR